MVRLMYIFKFSFGQRGFKKEARKDAALGMLLEIRIRVAKNQDRPYKSID